MSFTKFQKDICITGQIYCRITFSYRR